MKKTILGILFAGLLVLSVLPTSALAFDEGVWTYVGGIGGVTVTKYNGTSTVVTIPDTLGGCNVTGMGDDLFTHDDGTPPTVTSVTISASVWNIEDGVFWECRQLESINVAADNPIYKSVDGVMFSKDGSTLIHYPAAKVEIGNTYTIPNEVTTIGSSAFDHSKNLESITITDNVSSIESIAFWRCDALKSITIPKTVTYIGKGVFANCSALTEIKVDTDNPKYKSIDGVLCSKDGVQLLQFPAGSTGTAGSYTVPHGVGNIAENSFRGSNGLKNVIISSSVLIIEDCAFSYCEYLERAYFLGDEPAVMSDKVFENCRPGFTVYHTIGGMGFTNPWYGYPTLVYDPSVPCSVTFNMNGSDDTAPATQNIYAGVKADEPNTPSRWAYTFGGWYQNAECTGEAWDFSVPVTSNLSLYAKWTIESYPITYDLGGGIAGNPASYTVFDTFKLNNPTRPGYTFAGWKGTGITGTAMTAEILKWSMGARSYTATWTPITYAITYDLGGGTADNPASYTIESAAFTLKNPIKQGYTFTGWTGTGLSAATQTVTIPTGSTGDRSYTANWTRSAYTVTYDAQGGSAVDSMSRNAGETITSAPATVKSGYNFTGWYADAACNVPVQFPYASAVDTTLYAGWQPQPQSNYLAGVIPSSGIISPAFNKSKTSYKITIGENDASFTLTPVKEYDGVTMTINKQNAQDLTLPVANGKSVKFTVKVTLGKQSKTYTFTVTRAKSMNNALSSLTATTGALSQPFDPNVTNYTLTLDENTKSTSIKATAAAGKLAGVSPASSKVTLNNGQSKTVKITVKAQSGAKKVYTIMVMRAASTNADLKSLKAKGLTPGFNPAQTSYSITLPANKSSLGISAKAAGYKAAVSIEGGKASKNVAVANGQTVTVHITVTAQAGNKKDYVIAVTRL